jgi:hypothetical protein
VTIGDITLTDVQHVPFFTHDLISGTRLAQDGFDQLLSKDGDLFVSQNGRTVATGTLDKASNLVKFILPVKNRFAALSDPEGTQTQTPPKTMDINKVHLLWGHAAETMLHRTALSLDIQLSGKLNICPTCIQTKSNQKGKESVDTEEK